MRRSIIHIFWGLLICIVVAGLPMSVEAVPVVRLEGPTTVNVGENFDVSVYVDGVIGEEVLGFGFIVDHGSFSFNAPTIDSSFFDDISSGLHVAGIAFPGISGDNILLAILNFTSPVMPVMSGSYYLGINSDLSDPNQGLFTFMDFDTLPVYPLDASVKIRVNAPVPEPSSLILLGAGLSSLVGIRFRKKS